MDAIDRAAKAGFGSITVTCGKLMTGVTVREWGAILMLRSLKSPETYFQAAFGCSPRGPNGSGRHRGGSEGPGLRLRVRPARL
jgi:hypothetical protein